MVIVFTKKKRRQNVLVFVFLFVVAIIAFILWQGFYKKNIPIFDDEIILIPPREVKINFQSLEEVKKFETFTEINPFSEVFPAEDELNGGEIGRENPFLNY